ncbi:MAG: hypothetical protein EOM24_23650, partial [Chloroflexia bacterium]|nr:hypothetical protein [Chloroflexia bacterium]
SNVHRIYDHMVANMPDYAMVAWQIQRLCAVFEPYVLVTYNGNSFDVPMINNCLGAPVFTAPHVDVLRFARHYFPDAKGTRSQGGRTLGEMYELFLNRPLTNAHDAAADVIGTIDVLEAMRAKAGVTIEQLAEEQTKVKPYTVMPIGKYAGKLLHEVPKSWAKYMKEKATDMDGDLKATVDAVLAM